MTTTIRRDYDPERDRCEEERAEMAESRETERRAWVRFLTASVDMAAVQMVLAVGPTQETIALFEKADADLDAAAEALEACGVDVAMYLEAT